MKKEVIIIVAIFLTLVLASSYFIFFTKEEGVVYVGLMIHLEGVDNAPKQEVAFNNWAAKTREVADMMEKHGGRGTFEARETFVEACENWDDNVLKELYDRGHGIGVHADLGGGKNIDEGYTTEQMTTELIEKKKDIEELLGHEVRHVSGICSDVDWVRAAIDAGFKFTTGGVAMCAYSLPINKRPEGFKTNREISDRYHEIFPQEIEDRINPWRASTASNWLTEDREGDLVILASDGVLKRMYEMNHGESDMKTDEFDQKDIDQYIENLEKAIEISSKNKVNQMYVGMSIGNIPNMVMFEKWLESIEPYVESGKVEWKTLPEIYDIYIDSE